jgi:hypothetical protein
MPIMTAYRQQALACAAALYRRPGRPRDPKGRIPDAPKILLRNVYGWFVRQERGLYALSDQGRPALRARPERGERGLIGRDGGAFRRVLKPDLEVPCGPRLLGGNIAAPAFVTKQT